MEECGNERREDVMEGGKKRAGSKVDLLRGRGGRRGGEQREDPR